MERNRIFVKQCPYKNKNAVNFTCVTKRLIKMEKMLHLESRLRYLTFGYVLHYIAGEEAS